MEEVGGDVEKMKGGGPSRKRVKMTTGYDSFIIYT